jgi:hypothetical protein
MEEFKTNRNPGDPAPGGGLVGETGDRAERFMKLVMGRQEPGAIVTGRRVKKVNSEEGDRTPNGREGEILGSIAAPDLEPFYAPGGRIAVYAYFVKWDGDTVPVFATDLKVEEL